MTKPTKQQIRVAVVDSVVDQAFGGWAEMLYNDNDVTTSANVAGFTCRILSRHSDAVYDGLYEAFSDQIIYAYYSQSQENKVTL